MIKIEIYHWITDNLDPNPLTKTSAYAHSHVIIISDKQKRYSIPERYKDYRKEIIQIFMNEKMPEEGCSEEYMILTPIPLI